MRRAQKRRTTSELRRQLRCDIERLARIGNRVCNRERRRISQSCLRSARCVRSKPFACRNSARRTGLNGTPSSLEQNRCGIGIFSVPMLRVLLYASTKPRTRVGVCSRSITARPSSTRGLKARLRFSSQSPTVRAAGAGTSQSRSPALGHARQFGTCWQSG